MDDDDIAIAATLFMELHITSSQEHYALQKEKKTASLV